MLFSLAGLLLVIVALVSLVGGNPVAKADGVSISWDSGMLYPGQNNGNPEGPVGERAILHGQYQANQRLVLKLVAGDASASASSACLHPLVTVVKSVATDSNGRFDASFTWPAVAGQVNQSYSVCAYAAASGTPLGATTPFTVLSAQQPLIMLSASSVAPGGSIRVTGQNWVPPQPITVNIAGCAACEPGSTEVAGTTVDSQGLNTGTFSVTIPIPAQTKPGHYLVDAVSNTGLLEAYYTTGARSLTVAPASAPAATETATVPVAPTATATAANTSSGGAEVSGLESWLLVLLIAILMVALGALIVLLVYVLRQRRATRGAAGPVPASGPVGGGEQAFPYQLPPSMPGLPGYYQPVPYQPADPTGRPPGAAPSASLRQAVPPAEPRQRPAVAPAQHFPSATGISFSSAAVVSAASRPAVPAAVAPSLRCGQCGAPLAPDELFCGHCGSRRPGSDDGLTVRIKR